MTDAAGQAPVSPSLTQPPGSSPPSLVDDDCSPGPAAVHPQPPTLSLPAHPSTTQSASSPSDLQPSTIIGGLHVTLPIRVSVLLDGHPHLSLVDSGSSYSLLPLSFAARRHSAPYKGPTLRSISGSTLPVTGILTADVQLGAVTVRHSFLLCDITTGPLLGSDFLLANGVTLDFQTRSLLWHGLTIPFADTPPEAPVCRLVLSDNVRLRPGQKLIDHSC